MKKLSNLLIKSFIGPFLATFFISMFMLVMQFLWKYIDDLMGKGLEISIILELLFYVSASLLPLALPLAILLSSLIVMGNLGETNELTALKSSGLSIYRILRPLAYVIVLIALGTFYFSNYVIPIANYKWHSIIWDIQEKKMTSFLQPGSYTQEIDGFSIKVGEGQKNHFKDIIIHDRRKAGELKTITADSGRFYQSKNGEFLFFKLYNGDVIEELNRGTSFTNDSKGNRSIFPSRKSEFSSATYKMDMTGFKMTRSKDDLFKDDYEMLNVFQLDETVDSLQHKYAKLIEGLTFNTKAKHPYFQAISYSKEQENDTLTKQLKQAKEKRAQKENQRTPEKTVADSLTLAPVYSFSKMSKENRSATFDYLKSQLRKNIKSLEGQINIEKNRHKALRRYEIEFHRKFALSFAIILLFFIGAPLGAIVKRGGFGAPVVIAALLFMIYFVLITIGDGIAESHVVSPFLGMWGPNFILMPIAMLLMYSAANDKSLSFNLFSKIKNRLKRKKNE